MKEAGCLSRSLGESSDKQSEPGVRWCGNTSTTFVHFPKLDMLALWMDVLGEGRKVRANKGHKTTRIPNTKQKVHSPHCSPKRSFPTDDPFQNSELLGYYKVKDTPPQLQANSTILQVDSKSQAGNTHGQHWHGWTRSEPRRGFRNSPAEAVPGHATARPIRSTLVCTNQPYLRNKHCEGFPWHLKGGFCLDRNLFSFCRHFDVSSTHSCSKKY